MAESINYGKAQAGLLTPSDPCKGPLGYGLICTAADAEAWFEAGRQWSEFVRGLVATLKSKEPPAQWPAELKVTVQGAEETAKLFDDEPWIAYESDIGKWAEAQQYLRDIAGVLATRLRDEHKLGFDGPGGLDVPPPPGQLDTSSPRTALVVLGALGGVTLVGLTWWAVTRSRA